ncbi:NLI interacting factor-like phosphatase-domain-containing protein [Tuber indicum]|nr:NLI interacting factor-like phosphatase-domain-containing protein [Tuber indicum]
MNSLSILSSRVDKVIGATAPPATQRTDPFKPLRRGQRSGSLRSFEDRGYQPKRGPKQNVCYDDDGDGDEEEVEEEDGSEDYEEDEHGDLLLDKGQRSVGYGMWLLGPWLGAFRWFFSTLSSSGGWLVSFLYNDDGVFSPLLPIKRFAAILLGPFGGFQGQVTEYSDYEKSGFDDTSAIMSDSEVLHHYGSDSGMDPTPPAHHLRSRPFNRDSPFLIDEIVPRRSIRIRLYNEESTTVTKPTSVKSPTSPSPSLRLTKYPRNSGPTKPLLPSHPSPKTLILDLDETLIHSLAKGGRMTSGHMVEVKLDRQHAILYYVHKRPYCDEFLRMVCKWYNLVIFTASVQEYADPVIDWLEQNRKYFKGRYYRQHCTQRGGAYIKDISAVEPDLSKVMIIDNSPMSYIFHEDNAIPIEGWINDPTDIDLLHLIPLLQALQYVTDVRALLALRMGEID